MASTNDTLFVIQEAIQGKLHPNSQMDDSKDIDVDYVNSWTMEQSEDSLSARANGKKKITIFANKELSFTVESEVLDEAGLMFLLGATKDVDGKLVVGDTPTETYTYTGVAKLKYANGTTKIMDKEIPNCTPQITDSFGTSSLDLQTYSVKFTVGTGDDGNFLTMKEHQ